MKTIEIKTIRLNVEEGMILTDEFREITRKEYNKIMEEQENPAELEMGGI